MTRDRHLDDYEYRRDVHPSILARDNYTCQECGDQHGSEQGLCVHHIIPRSRGGSDDPGNLVTLCETCHILVHQPDSWDHFMQSVALRRIERSREDLAEMYNRFMAALYGQDDLPCDLWEGELVIFYPEDE